MIDTSDLVHMGFDTDADYDKFRRTVAVRTDASTYLLFTEQARLYCWYFGIMPLDALPNLENRMKNDPQWELVYDRKGITIYRHRVVIS
jgi:alpha-tubulin suppressor-like RCC1 family protein